MVELVDESSGLTDIVPDWRRLAEQRGSAFRSPEWFFASIRVAAPGWRPLVAVARDSSGSIHGVMPFAIPSRRRRHLRLGGALRCDLSGPAAEREVEREIAAAALEAVAAEYGGRSVIGLGNVETASSWWRPDSGSGLVAIQGPESVLPYAELEGLDWDGYLASRSRGLRSQIGRKMRALRRDHDVELRFTGTREELEVDLPTFFRLHEARWRDRPGASSLSDPRVRAFHNEFCSAALAQGWLRLLMLEIDGTAAAAWYGWCIGDRWSYYQAGFDPQWNRSSVGMLVLAESIRAAIEDGAREYDMLLGDEAFKSRFADRSRSACSVTLVAGSHPARLVAPLTVALRRAWRRIPASHRVRVKQGAIAVRARARG